jgi:hypothetical protein
MWGEACVGWSSEVHYSNGCEAAKIAGRSAVATSRKRIREYSFDNHSSRRLEPMIRAYCLKPIFDHEKMVVRALFH